MGMLAFRMASWESMSFIEKLLSNIQVGIRIIKLNKICATLLLKLLVCFVLFLSRAKYQWWARLILCDVLI